MGHTAILGGTGPEGMGLALRLALCGDEIVIGSRRAERAAAAAAKAVQRLGDAGGAANVGGRRTPPRSTARRWWYWPFRTPASRRPCLRWPRSWPGSW